MARGFLASPGTEYGPCYDSCSHKDCKETRTIAETICHYCSEPIGYNRGFYREDDKRYVHAVCLEEHIESERKKGESNVATD
mgnify:CR=1 FL=1